MAARLVTLILCATTGVVAGAQSGLIAIRDTGQAIACAVSAPGKSTKPDDDLVTIEIRVPAAPADTLLAKLPAQARDYSKIPIEVFLVPAPGKGAMPVAIKQRGPSESKLAPKLSTFLGGASDAFVEVKYPRIALVGGADLVAERSATSASGERITTQTRCRIAATDAAGWR